MGAGFLLPDLIFMDELSLGVDGLIKYQLFGQDLWITTTHVGLLIVMAALTAFAFVINRKVKKANPYEKPKGILNAVEMGVQAVDSLTRSNMGDQHAARFSNYIGTQLVFICALNISGLFGLRAPTADYGVTLGWALITFVMIHYNGFKYEKAGHVTKLFKPIILSPINIIGEIAVPLSMSLRLFGNVLSGTIMLGLIYGLLGWIKYLLFPVFSFLHIYFDVFSGAIQSYVFCMLTMVYVSQCFGEEDA